MRYFTIQKSFSSTLFVVVLLILTIQLAIPSVPLKDEKTDSTLLKKGSPVSILADIDKSIVTIWDLITYSVVILRKPEIDITIPEMEKEIKGLTLVNSRIDGPKEVGGLIKVTHWYQFRAEEVGSHIIPSFTIKYLPSSTDTGNENGKSKFKEIKTLKVSVEVKSVIEEGDEATDIRGLKSLFFITKGWKHVLKVIAMMAVPFLLVALLLRYPINRKKIEPEPEPPLSPYEQALKELEELKNKKLIDKRKIKAFYFELSEIFRRYLEGRYEFPAIDWTSEEIIPKLDDINEIQKGLLKEAVLFLKNTDIVKFAEYDPGIKGSKKEFKRSVSFIKSTRPRILEPLLETA